MAVEKDIKRFLIKLMQSIFTVLLWMLINVFAGIYKGYAFFDNTPGWANYLYYCLFIITLVLLIIYLYRKWKA